MTVYLLVYITVLALNIGGLVLDFFLELSGHQTISGLARIYPGVGVAILALQAAGLVALALHFWGTE